LGFAKYPHCLRRTDQDREIFFNQHIERAEAAYTEAFDKLPKYKMLEGDKRFSESDEDRDPRKGDSPKSG
jgi:hypothetical protein